MKYCKLLVLYVFFLIVFPDFSHTNKRKICIVVRFEIEKSELKRKRFISIFENKYNLFMIL